MCRLRLLNRLASDRSGAAAVEFALVAPALILLIVGSFEIAIMLFVGGTMESAVLAASRFGITGSTDEGVTREDRIREIIAERTLGFVDLDEAEINTLVYPRYEDIGQPEPFTDDNGNGQHDPGEAFNDVNGNGTWDDDMGTAGLGGPGDIVLYDIEYETGAITELLEPILGRIVHRAAVAVRNEPF
jgi:Flp pilus assembly protein TadG